METAEPTFEERFTRLSRHDKLRVLEEIERPMIEKERRIKDFIEYTIYGLINELEADEGNLEGCKFKKNFVDDNYDNIVGVIYEKADMRGIDEPEEYVNEVIAGLKKKI